MYCYSVVVFWASMITSNFLSSKDGDEDLSTPKIKPQSLDKNTDTNKFGSPLRNSLLLNKLCKETHKTDFADRNEEKTFQPPLPSRAGILSHSNCEVRGDSRKPVVFQCSDPLHKDLADPAATVLRCEKLHPVLEGEAFLNSSVLEAALSQTFSINPVVMVMDMPPNTEGNIYGNREHFSEHSYSRPDTGKHQLWRKIFSLHAKILDLDRREESTVAKIHALETEISHLKRDSAACKEKQKMFEDIISSKLM